MDYTKQKKDKSYNKKINKTYYTSRKFWKNTTSKAAALGVKMGLRQALGLVFAEVWFTVKDAIIECKEKGEGLFKSIGKAIKQGLENAKNKFSDIWKKFIEGFVAGVLSSLFTTLANIFLTNAKNVVKIIREAWASITQALRIIFVNPDDYPLGIKVIEAAKILATGASVIAGSMFNQLLTDSPVGGIPIVGSILPSMIGLIVTGIMSCSFLYLFDRSEIIKKAIDFMNNLPTIDNFNYNLKKQGEYLDRYLAELVNIDFELFKKQETAFSDVAHQLSLAGSHEETNACLINVYNQLGIDLPWKGYKDLDDFMDDEDSVLVFD